MTQHRHHYIMNDLQSAMHSDDLILFCWIDGMSDKILTKPKINSIIFFSFTLLCILKNYTILGEPNFQLKRIFGFRPFPKLFSPGPKTKKKQNSP